MLADNNGSLATNVQANRMKSAVLFIIALVLVLALVVIGATAPQKPEGFMTYPYLDLWDTYDAGDRGTFYGLMEGRSGSSAGGGAKGKGPSYRMRPPAFRGRVVA